MQITLPAKTLNVIEHTDVLVVGGGPAGIGAAVAAAREGASVMLLEKRGFLGGNITACYVESCNYFMKDTPFRPEGIFIEIENGYRERFECDDIRENAPFRFNSEYLKVYLDDFLRQSGVTVKLHSFVNDVVMDGQTIKAVIIQTKKGPIAVSADMIIDATGDGDIAFSAGAPYEQGREKDGLCQPGSVIFRVTGADSAFLTKNGDALLQYGKIFHEAYKTGNTGLSCKRQDLPFGRLTSAGQISYINYSCEYGLDPTDVDDLTSGEVMCRKYIMEIFDYLKENFEGLEHLEISSMSPEIGFRDSRRILGDYKLTIEDMESNRQFDDAIAVYPRFYDMLAPDGNMDGDGSVEGKGYHGHIYTAVEGNRSFQIPYRCLLPTQVNNLLTAGRCISADHVAESGVRAVSLCMLTGEAAGTAAAIACREKTSPREIHLPTLQSKLRAQGVTIPL